MLKKNLLIIILSGSSLYLSQAASSSGASLCTSSRYDELGISSPQDSSCVMPHTPIMQTSHHLAGCYPASDFCSRSQSSSIVAPLQSLREENHALFTTISSFLFGDGAEIENAWYKSQDLIEQQIVYVTSSSNTFFMQKCLEPVNLLLRKGLTRATYTLLPPIAHTSAIYASYLMPTGDVSPEECIPLLHFIRLEESLESNNPARENGLLEHILPQRPLQRAEIEEKGARAIQMISEQTKTLVETYGSLVPMIIAQTNKWLKNHFLGTSKYIVPKEYAAQVSTLIPEELQSAFKQDHLDSLQNLQTTQETPEQVAMTAENQDCLPARSLVSNTTLVKSLEKRSIACLEKFDYQGAARLLEKAVAIDPSNLSYRTQLANAYHGTKQFISVQNILANFTTKKGTLAYLYALSKREHSVSSQEHIDLFINAITLIKNELPTIEKNAESEVDLYKMGAEYMRAEALSFIIRECETILAAEKVHMQKATKEDIIFLKKGSTDSKNNVIGYSALADRYKQKLINADNNKEIERLEKSAIEYVRKALGEAKKTAALSERCAYDLLRVIWPQPSTPLIPLQEMPLELISRFHIIQTILDLSKGNHHPEEPTNFTQILDHWREKLNATVYISRNHKTKKEPTKKLSAPKKKLKSKKKKR